MPSWSLYHARNVGGNVTPIAFSTAAISASLAGGRSSATEAGACA